MLETTRLILRPLTEKDLDAIFAMRSDADIMCFIRTPQNKIESANWIKLVSSRWKSEKVGFCAVILKETNEFIGWCGLWPLVESGEIEVGYAIHKTFWGHGFASEAAGRFLQYGFDELNLEKIVAVANPANTGSRRVMEKIGMGFDYTGKFYERELVHYSITRKVFNAGRQIPDTAEIP